MILDCSCRGLLRFPYGTKTANVDHDCQGDPPPNFNASVTAGYRSALVKAWSAHQRATPTLGRGDRTPRSSLTHYPIFTQTNLFSSLIVVG